MKRRPPAARRGAPVARAAADRERAGLHRPGGCWGAASWLAGRLREGRPGRRDRDDGAGAAAEEDPEEDPGGEASRRRLPQPVDHSKVDYIPIRKDFYIESPLIAQMSEVGVLAALSSGRGGAAARQLAHDHPRAPLPSPCPHLGAVRALREDPAGHRQAGLRAALPHPGAGHPRHHGGPRVHRRRQDRLGQDARLPAPALPPRARPAAPGGKRGGGGRFRRRAARSR